MRTTLIIPDTIYERTKEAAKKEGCTISRFLTEAIEFRLLQMNQAVRSDRAVYCVKPQPMGKAKVDVSNREELYRAMEEE
jgi:predicted DNA-binding protein